MLICRTGRGLISPTHDLGAMGLPLSYAHNPAAITLVKAQWRELYTSACCGGGARMRYVDGVINNERVMASLNRIIASTPARFSPG